MSKIRKINLIKKNWILKGIRDLDKGSNPHSNGEIFSRFLKSLSESKKFNDKIIIDNIINMIDIIKIDKIIYIKIKLIFLIGN